jgi:NAD+ kinase
VKVGILANPDKAGARRTLDALREVLSARGIGWVMETDTAVLAGEADGVDASEFGGRVDVLAVLGGDGTMLHAVSKLGAFDKPVAGINIGNLGFLTTCTDRDLDAFGDALRSGRFTTSRRTLLEATVEHAGCEPRTFLALNEVTLARGQTARLVSLEAWVSGELLNHYRADGLIVATPTGSTAYSLSAGGPLVSPCAAVFLITPICPHTMSQRSLVVADDSVISLCPQGGGDGPVLFTVDGRDCMTIGEGSRVEVRKAKASFDLLRLEGHSFYEALRQKLNWRGG